MSNIYILSLYYHFILSSWPPSEFKSRRHRSDGTQPGPGPKPQQKREEHFGSLVQALMFSVPGDFGISRRILDYIEKYWINHYSWLQGGAPVR